MALYQLSKAEDMNSCTLIGEYSSVKEAKQKAKEICPDVKFDMLNDWTYGATGLRFYISKSCRPFMKIEQIER